MRRKLTRNEWIYMLMLLPGAVVMLLFKYIPMAGIAIAFQDFKITKGLFGSRFIGLKNFSNLLRLSAVNQAFINTVSIAAWNIALGLAIPIIFALLLNEVRRTGLKRGIQTIVYMPHFISWVVLAVTFKQLFSGSGIVNQLIAFLGAEKIIFLSSNVWFRPVIIATAQWKEFGWATIIFIAAITSIDPNLYEAAMMDGATRFKRALHVTLPGMMPIIVLKASLSLGQVLNANFDQIFNMYNELVYETGDVIQTYVYRLGLVQAQYGLSTAVSLLDATIGLTLIVTANKLAQKFANYSIF